MFVLLCLHRWHSHAGLQVGDGLAGPLIVRQPKSIDENGNHYDCDLPDHVIMLQNWQNEMSVNEFVPSFYQRVFNKFTSKTGTCNFNWRAHFIKLLMIFLVTM